MVGIWTLSYVYIYYRKYADVAIFYRHSIQACMIADGG